MLLFLFPEKIIAHWVMKKGVFPIYLIHTFNVDRPLAQLEPAVQLVPLDAPQKADISSV